MRRAASGTVAAIATLTLLSLGAPTASADFSPETDVIARVNAVRISVGALPLTEDPGLSAVAREWAVSVANLRAPTHNPRLQAAAPAGYTIIGENVGGGPDIATISDMLVAHGPHFANLVNRAFTRIGIGVARVGGMLWIVQDFSGGGAEL